MEGVAVSAGTARNTVCMMLKSPVYKEARTTRMLYLPKYTVAKYTNNSL